MIDRLGRDFGPGAGGQDDGTLRAAGHGGELDPSVQGRQSGFEVAFEQGPDLGLVGEEDIDLGVDE